MIRYKPRGQYSGIMDEHEDGPFVLHTEAQAEIDALHAECGRLTAMLQYEEGRRTRIGTHGPDCWKWGPSHYECGLREIDRLTAMLEPQKVLEADEVTESGFYLVRADNSNPWVPCVVSHFNARSDPLRMLLAGRSEVLQVVGEFIGPLPAPEVG